MNFKVICFDYDQVVRTEYFDTLSQAIYFENTEGLGYNSTSIIPMNREAELIMEESQQKKNMTKPKYLWRVLDNGTKPPHELEEFHD